MTVKLSELQEGTMIDVDGEVFHKHTIIEMIKKGKSLPLMYVITKEWTADILSQAYNDHVNNVDKETYSAPNKGELIEIDISDCTCGNVNFLENMCRGCLKKIKETLNEKMSVMEDELSELESNFEEVEFHLDEAESILLKNLLDQNDIEYSLNHEGIGFPNKKERDKATKIAAEYDLVL